MTATSRIRAELVESLTIRHADHPLLFTSFSPQSESIRKVRQRK